MGSRRFLNSTFEAVIPVWGSHCKTPASACLLHIILLLILCNKNPTFQSSFHCKKKSNEEAYGCIHSHSINVAFMDGNGGRHLCSSLTQTTHNVLRTSSKGANVLAVLAMSSGHPQYVSALDILETFI